MRSPIRNRTVNNPITKSRNIFDLQLPGWFFGIETSHLTRLLQGRRDMPDEVIFTITQQEKIKHRKFLSEVVSSYFFSPQRETITRPGDIFGQSLALLRHDGPTTKTTQHRAMWSRFVKVKVSFIVRPRFIHEYKKLFEL